MLLVYITHDTPVVYLLAVPLVSLVNTVEHGNLDFGRHGETVQLDLWVAPVTHTGDVTLYSLPPCLVLGQLRSCYHLLIIYFKAQDICNI